MEKDPGDSSTPTPISKPERVDMDTLNRKQYYAWRDGPASQPESNQTGESSAAIPASTNTYSGQFIERHRWMTRANCLGLDINIFFTQSHTATAYARKVCSLCVVRSECLEYAVADPDIHGIWADTNDRERRRIRKQRKML